MIPTGDDYLVAASEAARAAGVPVTLDEIITGFRVGTSGFQGLLGITPDLTCLAKVAAGGMPGGAVGGSEEIMSALSRSRGAEKVLHQGTFTGNPATAAAAVATIAEINATNACAKASEMGEFARDRLDEAFGRCGVAWRSYG
ncbi:aminotransferase class III-fold pyridoxal phosphate-dependent enzyme, partial [Rhizobiaceae sp. 2RAB30]